MLALVPRACQHAHMDTSKLLTERELCDELRCSRTFLYRARRRGLPHVRLSRRAIRYDLAAVRAWFAHTSPDDSAASR